MYFNDLSTNKIKFTLKEKGGKIKAPVKGKLKLKG
jgi:hypothetical protein